MSNRTTVNVTTPSGRVSGTRLAIKESNAAILPVALRTNRAAKKVTMSLDSKETLVMLASFSVQVHMYERAIVYASVGVHLFPEDVRLVEILAYAHMHNGDIEEANDVLGNVEEVTANISLLRAKLAILHGDTEGKAKTYLRECLQKRPH